MRTLLPACVVFFGLNLPAVLSASDAGPDTKSGSLRAELVDPDDAVAAPIRRTGERAIYWLGAKMLHEIGSAASATNPAELLALCHLKSRASDGNIVPGMPQVTAIKLTSPRLLNPLNAPDAAEQLVLDDVERSIARGEPPRAVLVQRIDLPTGGVEWRVYRPLAVLRSCVVCHGDAATQAPEVRAVLLQRAPGNPGTGYKVGEWRGLLRVTIAPDKTPPG